MPVVAAADVAVDLLCHDGLDAGKRLAAQETPLAGVIGHWSHGRGRLTSMLSCEELEQVGTVPNSQCNRGSFMQSGVASLF